MSEIRIRNDADGPVFMIDEIKVTDMIESLQAENERLRTALSDSLDAIEMALQFSTGDTREKVYDIKVKAQTAITHRCGDCGGRSRRSGSQARQSWHNKSLRFG